MFGWNLKNNGMTYRSAEMSGAYSGSLDVTTHGLVAGTRVASMMGWRGVESLAKGDMVLTFDNGMQEITDVRRVTICFEGPHSDRSLWPVIVPPEGLGNKEKLTLLPDQGVMLECEAAHDTHGDPFALVAVQALVGIRGIHRAAPVSRIELIVMSFRDDQVIYAEGGALILCPSPTTMLERVLHGIESAYEVLGVEAAGRLVECYNKELSDGENLGFPNMVEDI